MVELCIHVANVLYLLSFLARDMLWLRILTCLGLVLGVVFFTCQPAPMYGPTIWHLVFLGINFVQIRRLVLERRRLMLPPGVEQAAEAACKDLTHDQLLTLLTRAMWSHPGTLRDVTKVIGKPLTKEEEVVRDLALCRLSRKEMLNLLTGDVGNANNGGTANAPAQWRPAEFCHRELPFLTGVKGLALYVIPKVDVQVSGSFRSTPGSALAAGFTATNAYLAANSTLGRTLSGNAANVIIGIEEPNQIFTERRHELDVRIGKVLRFNKTRSVLSVDFYNALNSNAVVNQNQAYVLAVTPTPGQTVPAPAWLRPTEILNARLLKVSWAFDF